MLIGQRLQMSLVENKTPELWQNFMPKRIEIQNTISTDLYAVQIYEPTYFEAFNPNATFEKWATLEVTTFINIPETMESLIIPGGLYAVFEHKGQSTSIFEYIFSQWIPNSKYNLDQ
jgi:AraC family transcriptional regulator